MPAMGDRSHRHQPSRWPYAVSSMSVATVGDHARMMHGRPGVFGLRKTGEEFPAEASISKLAIDGQTLFTVLVRDVTVTRQLQEELGRAVGRFRFLAEAGEILGSSLETEDVVRRLAALAVRSFAACCIVEVSDGAGGLIRTRADRSSESTERLDHIDRSEADPGRSLWWPAASRREPMLVACIDGDWLRSQPADDPIVPLVRDVGATSLIGVPIVAGVRTVGVVLFLATGSGRSYGEADLQVAVDLARRTGLAAENGRLYRAAQAATRARDNVLGIVAHDLRSPLATAQIGADLLARHVPEDRRDQSRRVAETVRRTIGLATRLVQDLLDVARIESGRLELDVKLTSPAELVHHALDLYRPMANAASIRLEGEVSRDVPAVVADSDRIEQVLSNLLDNALKFTPAGGLVRIVAQRE